MCINYQGNEDRVMVVLSMEAGELPGFSEDGQECGEMRRDRGRQQRRGQVGKRSTPGGLGMSCGIHQEQHHLG